MSLGARIVAVADRESRSDLEEIRELASALKFLVVQEDMFLREVMKGSDDDVWKVLVGEHVRDLHSWQDHLEERIVRESAVREWHACHVSPEDPCVLKARVATLARQQALVAEALEEEGPQIPLSVEDMDALELDPMEGAGFLPHIQQLRLRSNAFRRAL